MIWPIRTRVYLAIAGSWLKLHAYHLLYALTLFSLTALTTWWSVFIRAAVYQEHRLHLEALAVNLSTFAVLLGHDQTSAPVVGYYHLDERLEIVSSETPSTPFTMKLTPFWPALSLRVKSTVLTDLQNQLKRRSLMVSGESGLFVVIIFISSFMLYRLILVEKKTALEVNELWSRVTHEIKTPIAGLRAFLETLKTHEFSKEELIPLVDIALKQIDRQEQLAENILVGRGLNVELTRLNLAQIPILDFLQNYLEHRSLMIGDSQVFLHADEDNLQAIADPDLLRVVLDNLLDNALKYGGDALVLDIKISTVKSKCLIQFIDHGPGFDPCYADSIFKAHRRLPENLPESRHGTGMGLYIARKLARKMHGELKAWSAGKGRGAQFTLFLLRGRV